MAVDENYALTILVRKGFFCPQFSNCIPVACHVPLQMVMAKAMAIAMTTVVCFHTTTLTVPWQAALDWQCHRAIR